MAQKKFWMVWREGSKGLHVKHESYDSVRTEAERLAEKNPGQKFYVLESLIEVQGTVTVEAKTTWNTDVVR